MIDRQELLQACKNWLAYWQRHQRLTHVFDSRYRRWAYDHCRLAAESCIAWQPGNILGRELSEKESRHVGQLIRELEQAGEIERISERPANRGRRREEADRRKRTV